MPRERMTQKIYKNVKIGQNAQIEDFVIIGIPPKGKEDGDLETIIGDNALIQPFSIIYAGSTIGNNAVIRSHTIIYPGNMIGDNFQTGHNALIRENNKIRDNVSIGSYCHVAFDCLLEDDVRLHTATYVFEKSILRKGCWLGPGVMLANAKYPLSKRAKEFIVGCEVGQQAKLGMSCTLAPGVKVGKNALIGLGAVVTKDVPENAIVVGCPAKVVGDVRNLKYSDGELVYPDGE